MASRVYVIQQQLRFDANKQRLVEKFDLEPARAHGEVHFLLSSNAAPFNSEPIIAELHDKLADFTQDDFLLLVGNPCIIGFAVAIAADKISLGQVKLLQWSGKDRRYIPVTATLFPDGED